MPQNHQNSLLSPALKSISKLLQEDDVQGMIIGGLAASLLGRPRYTNDIDLLILDLDNRLPEFIKKLNKFGIRPRIQHPQNFAKESRMLLMRHQESGINIDISMGILPFERDAVARRQTKSSLGLEIILPSPEDLIIIKSISKRPMDLEDIKAIILRHPNLDKKSILTAVSEFADVLEKKDLHERIRDLFDQET